VKRKGESAMATKATKKEIGKLTKLEKEDAKKWLKGNDGCDDDGICPEGYESGNWDCSTCQKLFPDMDASRTCPCVEYESDFVIGTVQKAIRRR
jgi:hypothetical protein